MQSAELRRPCRPPSGMLDCQPQHSSGGSTGAATRRVLTRVDDPDGSPDAHTVRFGLDGQAYEIELTDAHAQQFREGSGEPRPRSSSWIRGPTSRVGAPGRSPPIAVRQVMDTAEPSKVWLPRLDTGADGPAGP
jgi:hypothetical protein